MPSLYDGQYPNVVRFGSRSKSEKVSQMSIHNVRRKLHHFARRRGVIEEANNAKRDIKLIRQRIEAIHSMNIVLSYDSLKEVMTENHRRQFGDNPNHAWFQWLHTLEKSWYKEVEKQYQNESSTEDIQKQLTEIVVNKSADESIKVVTEAEHAYNERYLEVDADDDINLSDTVLKNARDLDRQLNKLMDKKPRPEKKCLSFLRLEKVKSCKELHYGPNFDTAEVEKITNLWKITIGERWKLYRSLVIQYLRILHQTLREHEKRFNEIFDDYKKAAMELDESIIQNSGVIAMTTTATARYSESLNKVGPLITIIEEAAEVPEAHIITAINKKCQHLILIGDHCQLEPKPAVYELARDYNLSLSLFERMVKNDMSYHCLQRQHRMRPEISELVRHIYPVLIDNENVKEYEPIKGVCNSLFFITHTHKEKFNDDGRSFSNEHEAEYLKELCSYLIKQGYKGSDITIIAAYSGQLFCLKDKMPRKEFEGVNICVLDNYQGEENEIILLSLVRSNENGEIGFLNRKNRICVALSRAKKGMFIIGNGTTLAKYSKHWRIVLNKLQNSENKKPNFSRPLIGRALPLYCQNHPDEQGVLAELPADFKKVPDGGCNRMCEYILECGHQCRFKCHPFNHKNYICKKQCNKRCEEGHVCKQQCHFKEDCDCTERTLRTLKCGHTVNLPCNTDFANKKCRTQVEKTLSCGHKLTMECSEDPSKTICMVIVDRLLPCEHTCNLKCNVDYIKYKCLVTVRETRKECGHEFSRKCHDKSFEKNTKCKELVREKRSTCDHTVERACFDKSFEERNECNVKIVKQRSDCGHEYQRQCFDNSYEVKIKCQMVLSEKLMSCGHTYERLCSDKDVLKFSLCKELIVDNRPGCGHEFKRICSDVNSSEKNVCLHIVTKTIPNCGHDVEIECHKDAGFERCMKKIEKRFECKHSTTINCYQNNLVKCTSACNECCINGHVCKKPCHYPDPCNCQEKIATVLEKCKHTVLVPCLSDVNNFKCYRIVKKCIEACGHLQDMECCTEPNTTKCRKMVSKVLPACGHEVKTECFRDPGEVQCTKDVYVSLEMCGHKAIVKCYQKATDTKDIQCKEKVEITHPDCGHSVSVLCPIKNNAIKIPACREVIESKFPCGHLDRRMCGIPGNKSCKEKCQEPLNCGHLCPGKCQDCRKRNNHRPCTSNCDKELICGHQCESAKCMECKPCNKTCSFACVHVKCKKACIDPCTPCKKKCFWSCEHYKCTRLCHEDCNRPPCNDSCLVTLKCGHVCPGYCGEPCPTMCYKCQPESFHFDSRATEKTITFIECGHSFNVTTIDTLIENCAEKRGLVFKCPKCCTVIYYHPRYNKTFKRQKLQLELIKKEIRRMKICSKTFPTCDTDFVKKCEMYEEACSTFIQITQHLQQDNEIFNQLQWMEEQLNAVSHDIKTTKPPLGYRDMLRLSDNIFRLHINWVYCLVMSEPRLFKKTFEVEWQVSDQENSIDSILDTAENIFETAFDQIGTRQYNVIENLIKPIVAAMEDYVHMVEAYKYPTPQVIVGVHYTDWEVCCKGHIKCTVLNRVCLVCGHLNSLEASPIFNPKFWPRNSPLPKTETPNRKHHDALHNRAPIEGAIEFWPRNSPLPKTETPNRKHHDALHNRAPIEGAIEFWPRNSPLPKTETPNRKHHDALHNRAPIEGAIEFWPRNSPLPKTETPNRKHHDALHNRAPIEGAIGKNVKQNENSKLRGIKRGGRGRGKGRGSDDIKPRHAKKR